MNALEQVQMLKDQAIAILLEERGRIDEQLTSLGYGKIKTTPKRGRPRKDIEAMPQPD